MMRDDLAREIGAYVGAVGPRPLTGIRGRLERFDADAVDRTVTGMVERGWLIESAVPARTRGRPVTHYDLTGEGRAKLEPLPTVVVRRDLLAEHKAAMGWRARINVRLLAVHSDPKASEARREHALLALRLFDRMTAAPHVWGCDGSLDDLRNAVGHGADGRQGMRAVKLLAELGAVDLTERKGTGRASTLRLARPMPYPAEEGQ
jgi:hypothetical protein